MSCLFNDQVVPNDSELSQKLSASLDDTLTKLSLLSSGEASTKSPHANSDTASQLPVTQLCHFLFSLPDLVGVMPSSHLTRFSYVLKSIT